MNLTDFALPDCLCCVVSQSDQQPRWQIFSCAPQDYLKDGAIMSEYLNEAAHAYAMHAQQQGGMLAEQAMQM